MMEFLLADCVMVLSSAGTERMEDGGLGKNNTSKLKRESRLRERWGTGLGEACSEEARC